MLLYFVSAGMRSTDSLLNGTIFDSLNRILMVSRGVVMTGTASQRFVEGGEGTDRAGSA